MAALEVLIFSGDKIRIPDRVSDRVQPETAGDSEITGSWGASPPPWDIDVGGAPGAWAGVAIAVSLATEGGQANVVLKQITKICFLIKSNT